MEKSVLLEKEGLSITEFTNHFFQQNIEQSVEVKTYIQKLTRAVQDLQKMGKTNTWHCIFQVIINNQFPDGLQKPLGLTDEKFEHSKYKELNKILSAFYTDPFFLALDVAQKMEYNLCRLEGNNVYDISKEDGYQELKELQMLLDIGRKKYDIEKDISEDLIPDLKRLENKCNQYENDRISNVYLPWTVEGSQVTLESYFLELNLLYIGNEKFQNYLFHIKPELFMIIHFTAVKAA